MATAYIETTIPSYYVARTSDSLLQAAKQAATRKWWDQGCSDFDLFTSLETLDEASKGDSLKAADRLEMLKDIPLLPLPDEGLNLAQQLVESGIVPPKAASDALHIAVASVHRIDYLVTWNFKHIANPFIRDRLRLAVASAGFDLPVMCSPDELLQNEDEDI
jgi:predicted nucleic acid-binding protein